MNFGWTLDYHARTQDTYLFPGRIPDNLCWLSGPRGETELWAALEHADSAPFVKALTAGLGYRLSSAAKACRAGNANAWRWRGRRCAGPIC